MKMDSHNGYGRSRPRWILLGSAVVVVCGVGLSAFLILWGPSSVEPYVVGRGNSLDPRPVPTTGIGPIQDRPGSVVVSSTTEASRSAVEDSSPAIAPARSDATPTDFQRLREYHVQQLEQALTRVAKDPSNVVNMDSLLGLTLAARFDLEGRSLWSTPSEPIPPGYTPGPGREAMISHGDRFGTRRIQFGRDEFPVYWELRALEDAPRPFLTLPPVPDELGRRILDLAHETVDLLGRD